MDIPTAFMRFLDSRNTDPFLLYMETRSIFFSNVPLEILFWYLLSSFFVPQVQKLCDTNDSGLSLGTQHRPSSLNIAGYLKRCPNLARNKFFKKISWKVALCKSAIKPAILEGYDSYTCIQIHMRACYLEAQPIITTRIYVLHKITIALKFMSYINSDLQIPAKKLQTPG